jgi:hypothetical protein
MRDLYREIREQQPRPTSRAQDARKPPRAVFLGYPASRGRSGRRRGPSGSAFDRYDRDHAARDAGFDLREPCAKLRRAFLRLSVDAVHLGALLFDLVEQHVPPRGPISRGDLPASRSRLASAAGMRERRHRLATVDECSV